MRTFFGMILGCALTIGAVYLHDVQATSSAATSTTAIETRQIVNWDVAQANWNKMTANAQDAWTRLKENVRRATT
jgi:ABC-type protease/lipase transport system fused ATPase/permease subunit